MTNSERTADVESYAAWCGGHTLMPREYAPLIRDDVPWLIRYARQMEDALRKVAMYTLSGSEGDTYAAIAMAEIASNGLREVE